VDAWWFVALALALVCAIAGLLFRAGLIGPERPWYREYSNRGSPASVRNLPLGLLPFGLAFVLLVLSIPAFDASRAAGIVAVVAAFLLGLVGTGSLIEVRLGPSRVGSRT
jgi:hypothetical protein